MNPLGQGQPWKDVRNLRVALGDAGLSIPGGWLPFAMYGTDPYLIAGDAYPYGVTLSRACTIRGWWQACVVATTNNGSNYWNIRLYKRSDMSLITTLTTAAMTAGTWATVSSTGRSDALTEADVGLYIFVTKTGSPGTISLLGPAVFVT